MAELLTLEEASRYLKVTKITVYRLARSGRIPASKVGKLWRFQKARLDAWLETSSNRSRRSARSRRRSSPHVTT